MPDEVLVEPLDRSHDRVAFDCGETTLNQYLARYARQNQESGIARTFVAAAADKPTIVLGYYTLTVGGIDKKNLPPAAVRRFPNFPIPVARLARLAVARCAQKAGLGEHLLMDALARCLRVAEEIGIVAILVDAKHVKARRFYERYEFNVLPDRELTLWITMQAVRRLFDK